MIKKILVFFFAMFAVATYAQNGNITGTVVDTDGEPLIGVTAIIKGTTTGTVTDFDGNFTLTGKVGDVIVFSFMGMVAQEHTFNGSLIHVVMRDDT
ncbi:MAG: carboxypeptidase-like regulatory domain-containing protein [Tannerellaceae bacterium]|nr:carboxypeptidase-like regulatory domain-containing protein [Tannerellaceae bacterium]